MAIETNKPEPLEIGGTYHYTLSSYSPVEIEIKTLRTTDADVDFALERLSLEAHSELSDEFVKERLGVENLAMAKQAIRAQIEQMNAAHAEQEKQVKAGDALAERLEQRIPDAEVSRFKQLIEDSMMHDAAHMQVDVEQLKMLSGITPDSLEEMARLSAAHEAAFTAYADEQKIKVSEDDLLGLLGGDPAQIDEVVKEAKKNKKLDALLRDLRPRKAALEVMSEAKVTFQLEPKAEAEERASHYPELLQMIKESLKSHECNHAHGDGECCGGGDGSCDCKHKD